MKRIFLTLFSLLFLPAIALSIWGASCRPVGSQTWTPPAFTPATPTKPMPLNWDGPNTDGFYKLMQGPFQIGSYHPEKGHYEWNGKKWSEPMDTASITFPVPLKKQQAKAKIDEDEKAWQTHGVIADKISPETKITRKGKVIELQEAEQAIHEAGQLTDDRLKPTLTVIGSDADLKRIKDMVAGSARVKGILSAWKVQYYEPNHHHLKKWPQVKTGSPWLVFIRPDAAKPGKEGDAVLEKFSCASEQDLFAAVQEATPRMDPNWKPTPPQPAPGPNGPSSSNIDLTKLPGWLYLLIGGGAAFLFFYKPKEESNKP